MSIIQGGNGFPALHPAVFHYMVTGTYLNIDIPLHDIPDAGVRCLTQKVMSIVATMVTVQGEAALMLDCFCPGPPINNR